MHRQNSTWNRQELYERVWQFPLRKLAIEYGISDVGLAKVCRKLEIPLPGLGHWTKIACGHTIERPPLPAMVRIPTLIGGPANQRFLYCLRTFPSWKESNGLRRLQLRL